MKLNKILNGVFHEISTNSWPHPMDVNRISIYRFLPDLNIFYIILYDGGLKSFQTVTRTNSSPATNKLKISHFHCTLTWNLKRQSNLTLSLQSTSFHKHQSQRSEAPSRHHCPGWMRCVTNCKFSSVRSSLWKISSIYYFATIEKYTTRVQTKTMKQKSSKARFPPPGLSVLNLCAGEWLDWK